VGKIAKKQSEGVRFLFSALNIQCHIVKKTLLQTAFLAILPTGLELDWTQRLILTCSLI